MSKEHLRKSEVLGMMGVNLQTAVKRYAEHGPPEDGSEQALIQWCEEHGYPCIKLDDVLPTAPENWAEARNLDPYDLVPEVFSTRIANTLYSFGVHKLKDIEGKSLAKLLKTRGCGRNTYSQIRQFLVRYKVGILGDDEKVMTPESSIKHYSQVLSTISDALLGASENLSDGTSLQLLCSETELLESVEKINRSIANVTAIKESVRNRKERDNAFRTGGVE